MGSAPGAGLRLSYVGGSLALIGERGPEGGKAVIALDGKRHTISTRSRTLRARTVLFRAPGRARHHRLTLRVLSGRLAIEGLAITARRA